MMNNYINFLIQLTEKDKRVLIALFIILILIFVLIAYIGQGVKNLMKRYSRGIDGYMHELCKAKLVNDPREFRIQVYKKETKLLYERTRWIFRVFIVFTVAFIAYSLIVRPGGGSAPFAYVGENIRMLFFDLDCPKEEFFGIKNFPVDWPYIARKPSPSFTLPAIVSYIMLIVWVATFIGVFTSTLRFIACIDRGRRKSVEVFSRSLDDANFVQE